MQASSGDRPTVALLCATFLRPEMLHIHRHVKGLSSFSPLVITQKREGDWPVERIVTVPRSPFRFWGRAIEDQTGIPWQISSAECQQILRHLEGVSLLHVFFGNVAVHFLPLFRELEIPFVVSFHGSDVTGPIATNAYSAARKELFDRARLILARSNQLAQRVIKLGCPERKSRIMRTVLPEIGFLERHAPPDGAWRIVQASRLVPKKGLGTALRAFATFKKLHPAATFTIAGEGPMESELRTLAQELGISKDVKFVGFLNQGELLRLFEKSHIFLHPSEMVNGDVEGIPNSLLEAMAHGLPVVATNHGGIPEVIIDHETGILCPERDVTALATALHHLATEPELSEEIARAGSRWVKETFSLSRQIANTEAIYREAMGTAENPGSA